MLCHDAQALILAFQLGVNLALGLERLRLGLSLTLEVSEEYSHESEHSEPLCSQLTASPKAAAWLILGGDLASLLRRQTSGAEHSRAGRTWRAL